MGRVVVGLVVALLVGMAISAAWPCESYADEISLVYDGNMLPDPNTEITVYVHSDTMLLCMGAAVQITGNATITGAMETADCNQFGWDPGWNSDPYIDDANGWAYITGVKWASDVSGTVGYVKFVYHGGCVTVSFLSGDEWSCAFDAYCLPVSFSTDTLTFGTCDPNQQSQMMQGGGDNAVQPSLVVDSNSEQPIADSNQQSDPNTPQQTLSPEQQTMYSMQSGASYFCSDLTSDDIIDFRDFTKLAANWQQTGTNLEGDFDASGTVDSLDLIGLMQVWLQTAPTQAAMPSPANNATQVSTLAHLYWASGSNATSHKLYLGTNLTDVKNATETSPEYKDDITAVTYDPGYLTQNTTYYWRVDEVGANCTAKGKIWQFSTINPTGVANIKIFTSTAYNDNAGAGIRDGQVHFDSIGATGSNAYPNLYIQITATGGNSGAIDQITFPVSSVSDTTGIPVDFNETGANTGIYRTVNPIHLTSGTSSSATLELKVFNEEILKVSTTSGPKVDKGEYSSMTGILCQYAHNHALGGCNPNAGQGVTDQAFNAFDQRIGTAANHRWVSRDSSRCTNLSSSALRNAGSTSSADLLIECSHGKAGDIGEYKYYVCDGLGLCGYNTYWALYNPTWPAMSNDPARVWYDPLYYVGPPLYELAPNDWRNDVEWVVLYSCDVLDNFYKWYEPLRGTGEHCHGILASYGTLSTGTDVNPIMKNHLTAFYDNMATKTVVNAYMEAAAAVGQWGAAAIFNNDNKNDYFNNVTPDTANNLIYCTYFSYQVRQEGTALGSWDELNDPNVADGNNILYEIPVEPNSSAIASIQCAVPSERPQLAQMSAETEELLLPFSTMFVMEDNNDVNAPPVDSNDANTPDQPLSITPAEAITMAADFIEQDGGGMPTDANVGAIISRVVKIYSSDANDVNVSEPNSHYVKRAIIEYRHKVDGIEIVGDSISVTIENDQVVDYARNWHDMIAPDSNSQQTIDANEALITAVANIPHVMLVPDTGFTITDISLCYYITTDENECSMLIPVWRFEVGKKSWVYVNAFSGEFIGI